MKKLLLPKLAILLLMTSALSLTGGVNAASITLDTTIRDFSSAHDDFQNAIGGGGFTTGLVESMLGPDGKPVYIGGNSLSTEANFNEWYNDTNGVNQTFASSLTATEAVLGSGLFTFSSNSYFPIDDMGFGNEGNSRNYHFTTEINTNFVYTGFDDGDDFTFTGDDDVWVFLDGMLVIDLGGTHRSRTASVDIDSLGLTVGEIYSLDIFHAERQTIDSNFSFTTAAMLVSDPDPVLTSAPTSLLFMLFGLSGLTFRSRLCGKR